MDKLKEQITIYHKADNNWLRYNVKASVRNTFIRNKDNTGSSNVNSAIIRIFDIDNQDYEINNGDVIVISNVEDEVISAPLTELRKKYGKEKVLSVSNVEQFRFEDEDMFELNHIKIGAI